MASNNFVLGNIQAFDKICPVVEMATFREAVDTVFHTLVQFMHVKDYYYLIICTEYTTSKTLQVTVQSLQGKIRDQRNA